MAEQIKDVDNTIRDQEDNKRNKDMEFQVRYIVR